MNDLSAAARPNCLLMSRVFPASCDLVFKAWSSAEHIRQWFSPAGCSVPEAEVEFRRGGVFNLCMRLPDGTDHWVRATFLDVVPPDRLVFAGAVSCAGIERFFGRTTVTFEPTGFGTKMTVQQEYDVRDPDFIGAIEGASEGWRTTLDKLGHLLARMQGEQKRSAVHAIFSLERTYDAAPADVFRALSEPAAKARWFSGGDEFTELERVMDVRPGGRERLRGKWPSGIVTTFDAVYFDVVANERLVYAYEMQLDERKISVSLATLELKQEAGGTRLKVTEQGAFLDGYEDRGAREHGTGDLLDRLGESLHI
jgi:uncharacterized protein YndB with AHSA1/START domain